MTKRLVIVDYGMGNIRSVVNAFEYLGAKPIVSGKPTEVAKADAVVVPGQGAFRECIRYLKKSGLDRALAEAVINNKKPYLGICLGLQILGTVSVEGGNFSGLSWIPGRVRKIKPGGDLKVPHLGWNELMITRDIPLFKGLSQKPSFYFAHSYILFPEDKSVVVGTTNYGGNFPVAVARDNITAVQFHPEKSHHNGLKLIDNFLKQIST